MPTELTERHWWAILVMASEVAQKGDYESHEVSTHARMMLVQKFGLNLDDIDIPAREEFARLWKERKEHNDQQKALFERAVKAMKQLPWSLPTAEDRSLFEKATEAVKIAREQLGAEAPDDQVESLATEMMERSRKN